jgi:hypothetical protein
MTQSLTRRDSRARTRLLSRIRPEGRNGAEPAAHPAWPGPVLLLAVIALCYAAAQLFLVAPDIALGYDEAVYASQFSGNGKPAGFHASRGWGTAIFVAPVVMVSNSTEALRLYLTGASALLLFFSFRVWFAVRPGYTVPTAAAIFAGCWTTVFYGNEVMPNLYTALGTVALTGLVLRTMTSEGPVGRMPLARVAAVAAVLPLFRPTDALVVSCALGGVAAVMLSSTARRRSALLTLAALSAGSVVGYGQWVVESILRYGSVVKRLEFAAQNLGSFQWLVEHYARAMDGPTLCAAPKTCGPVLTGGLVWLAGLALLASVGLLTAWRREHRIPVVVAAVVGTCIAGAYLYYAGFVAPRYLLPAYGLWAIPVGEGFLFTVAALRRRTRTVYAVGCCSLVLGGYLYLQNGYLTANLEPVRLSRGAYDLIADSIRKIGYRQPCLVYGWNTPQIAHILECEPVASPAGKPIPAEPNNILSRHVLARFGAGYSVIVLYRGDATENVPYMGDWPEYRLTAGGWYARVKHGAARTAP